MFGRFYGRYPCYFQKRKNVVAVKKLKVSILYGINLPIKSWFNKLQESYIQIESFRYHQSLDKKSSFSHSMENENPVWNETIKLKVSENIDETILVFTCFVIGGFGYHEKRGEFLLRLSNNLLGQESILNFDNGGELIIKIDE
jgi:hypothetical protein